MFKTSDIEELKEICRGLGRELSDEQAISVGERIVRFLLNSQQADVDLPMISIPPALSDREKRALEFIEDCKRRGVHPSVRAIARIAGFSSSRSGQRIINNLQRRGLILRDAAGVRNAALGRRRS